MPNYTHTVHVPCQWNIKYIEAYIRSLTSGIIPVATELNLRVQLAANLVIDTLSDPLLPIAPAGQRILYVFTLPEFFFRTIKISGFDLLDAATRNALSLAPIPPIPEDSQADIQVPATDSCRACTTIGLQVATQLTALAPLGSPVHTRLMDSVLVLGSALMYAGYYSFEIGRPGRKVDNLAIVLRLTATVDDALPTWSVHLTWKILNSAIDTMKNEKDLHDIGFGHYAPAATPNHLMRPVALSRMFMHGATKRTATGKERSHIFEKHAWEQLQRTYLEAQFLDSKLPPPREYLRRSASATASPSEVEENHRMALVQLGLDSGKARRHMEESAGNGTWLTSPGAALPSCFLQVPNALTIMELPIFIYIEICMDHRLRLFRFLSEFRPRSRVNFMVLISAGAKLDPRSFIDLPSGTGDFVVLHNDGLNNEIHTGRVMNSVLNITDLCTGVTDRTTAVQAIILRILPPPATTTVFSMKARSILTGFSNILPIL